MPSPQRVKRARDVQEKLALVSGPEHLLPMPHDLETERGNKKKKIRLDEWEEFYQRRALYRASFPDYDKRVGKPLPETVRAIWCLLAPYMEGYQGEFDELPRTSRKWLTTEEKQLLQDVSKEALIIVLDTFVVAGLAHRGISYNNLFDALCRKYSDNHRASKAQTVRDMRWETVWRCQRDLQLCGIDAHRYWKLAVGNWTTQRSNPLFEVKRGRGGLYRVIPGRDLSELSRFESILEEDRQYTRSDSPGLEVLPADVKPRNEYRRYKVCAEWPYNQVQIGERSRRLLRLQSKSCLLFDVDNFNSDYGNALRLVELLSKQIWQDWALDVSSHSIGAWITAPGHCKQVIARYERAMQHINAFRRTYEQVKHKNGQILIHSGFARVINRRFQPLHLWPAYVTSKNDNILGETSEAEFHRRSENQLESYRHRWFKACDPETQQACELVGFDISSSQTQILATLLCVDELEKLTMGDKGVSFKETMAKWAWDRHNDATDRFELRGKTRHIPPYSGPSDPRLEELCKALWMRLSYGSPIGKVVNDQDADPDAYGPGWTVANAKLFREFLYGKFPEVERFLGACRKIADVSFRRNKYAGVTFVDPFDQAKARWNPVAKEDREKRNWGCNLVISIPGKTAKKRGQSGEGRFNEAKPNAAGDYPVDIAELRKMVSPCLVHLLDAYYSSLVMERLAEQGVGDFVGIHDCWLVPERVSVNGEILDGRALLKEAMREAAREWYKGLGPIYERLLGYLRKDEEYSAFVRNARDKWATRVKDGFPVLFLAKPSPKSLQPDDTVRQVESPR